MVGGELGFKHVVLSQVQVLPWVRAVAHFCGAGLESGVAVKDTFATYAGDATHQGVFLPDAEIVTEAPE